MEPTSKEVNDSLAATLSTNMPQRIPQRQTPLKVNIRDDQQKITMATLDIRCKGHIAASDCP